jgi:hypothetical protein
MIHPYLSSSREMVLSREFSTQKILSLKNATSCFRPVPGFSDEIGELRQSAPVAIA